MLTLNSTGTIQFDENMLSMCWNYQLPIPSMYGISTYIYHKNQPNVGKYTIYTWIVWASLFLDLDPQIVSL